MTSSAVQTPVARLVLRAPYLIFLADIRETGFAKTGLGIAQWCPEKCVGQLRLPGCAVDARLPDLDIAAARAAGARSLILGAAPIGGDIKPNWVETLCRAAEAGLDIVSGLHRPLSRIPGLADAAARGGGRLVEVRVPPPDIPIASGRKRSGLRLLAVGTDCAVGKKYSALSIARELQRRGLPATFRATGQTGIMIAGEGMPIDAVVCDFTAGAAEILSPDNAADHWDVIEGQGSLFHPAYAGVSLGLLHGSQADAIVVCHEAGREQMAGYAGYPVPDLQDCIDLHLQMGRRTNPSIRCVGVSINTARLPADRRRAYLEQCAQRTGMPCVDPLVEGPAAIVDRMLGVCA